MLQLQFLSSWWWAVCSSKHVEQLTLNPLTWKIWWAPNNASRWQMGFNSAFKGLRNIGVINSTTRSHLFGYFCTIDFFFSFLPPPPPPPPPGVPVPVLRPSQFYFELVHAAFSPGAKAAGDWNWSLTSIWCGEWWVELKHHGFPTLLPARLYYAARGQVVNYVYTVKITP